MSQVRIELWVKVKGQSGQNKQSLRLSTMDRYGKSETILMFNELINSLKLKKCDISFKR